MALLAEGLKVLLNWWHGSGSSESLLRLRKVVRSSSVSMPRFSFLVHITETCLSRCQVEVMTFGEGVRLQILQLGQTSDVGSRRESDRRTSSTHQMGLWFSSGSFLWRRSRTLVTAIESQRVKKQENVVRSIVRSMVIMTWNMSVWKTQ